MNSDNLLLTVAAIAVIISFVGISVTYNSISTFENLLTGFVTENGTVNVTIVSSAVINITSADSTIGSKLIDFGAGSVVNGQDRAILMTNATSNINSNGWNEISEGFLIRNIGNVNVTLDVHSDANATDLFPNSNSPGFQYELSNNLGTSCVGWQGGSGAGNFIEFTTTAVRVCDAFQPLDSNNEFLMDIRLDIPGDAAPGDDSITVTLTYAEA